MTEFGHVYGGGNGFRFDRWGVGPFTIAADGKSFRFEDSDRFGPALINSKGDPLKNRWPPERSPFWRAHRIWVRQGRRTEDGVKCIWDEPKPNKFYRINRRNSFLVEAGDEDGAWIEIERPSDQDTPTVHRGT